LILLKDFARSKQDKTPAWILHIQYAEEFGCHPHEVANVPLRWFQRWLLWRKTQAARNAWDRKMRPGKKAPSTKEELDLFSWTMNGNKY